MPRETIVLQVFVASPSDVKDERVILETVVTQLNQTWSTNLGVIFEIAKWETNTHPAFGSDPQDAINQQIGMNYDLFVGIFWGRLGTPTPRAPSGTVEEFERAYARFKQTCELPEIMLYFKDAPISPSKIDTNQLKAVQDFKETVANRGGLYAVFEDLAGFESSVRAHLSAVAQKFVGRRSGLTLGSVQAIDVRNDARSPEPREEEDYGYFDYLEVYETRVAEMTDAMTQINVATARVGEQLRQRSAEMDIELREDPKRARRFIKLAADDMNIYAETVARQVRTLSTSRKLAFDALSNALALHGEFKKPGEDLRSLRETLVYVIGSVKEAREGMGGMRSAADNLPRISKELNLAKGRVVSQLDRFLAEIESTSSTVANIVEAIDRIINQSR